MDTPTASLLTCISLLFAIITVSVVTNNPGGSAGGVGDFIKVNPNVVLQHVRQFIVHGDSEDYATSRATARQYINHTLTTGDIRSQNILWHYFEWKEKQQEDILIWSGVNILVWTNNTPIDDQKVRAFSSHYDTLFWGKNQTAGASSLAGAALLMEIATSLYQYQQQQKKTNSSFVEVPYLFIFFDHHEPGGLGSKALAQSLPIQSIEYFISIGSVGYKGSYPILQTFPYIRKRRDIAYTPNWLASSILRENVGLKIGSTLKTRSLLYQAYRYHWCGGLAQITDDAAFAFFGVPTALLTDYDDIFEPNPHHLKPTDQVWTLESTKIQNFAKLISRFIFTCQNEKMKSGTHAPSWFHTIPYPWAHDIITTAMEVFAFVFSGVHQYIAVGPFIFGFVEIASLSFVIIAVVCFNSVHQYSKVYSQTETVVTSDSDSDSEDSDEELKRFFMMTQNQGNQGIWQGHKILVVHMLLMSAAVMVDTVFAFEMLVLSFAALSTIHFSRFYINIASGFICSILCVNFLYKDVILLGKFGIRTYDLRELRLAALIIVYFIHSGLLLVYGYDYQRKKFKLKKN